MIPRGILDIEWRTLLAATCRSLPGRGEPVDATAAVEQLWDPERPSVVFQSVRSGLDALLQAVNWPPGSEILMSAVTIPEMARVVEEHRLVPVPVDVSPVTLAPCLTELQSRLTKHTRAILVAHLFGSRLDLHEIAQVARRSGVFLWEDVAQGYAADGFPGDRQADVSFFSFGMIKAQTALGGAILRFGDGDLARECRAIQEHWPPQPRRAFRKKLRRAVLLRFLSQHAVFTTIAGIAGSCGVNYDAWLSRSVRGFAPAELFSQLRRRPCPALVDLLFRRLRDKKCRWLLQKTAQAEHYCVLLPQEVQLGPAASFPTRWVLPIRSHNPPRLLARLQASGYDATARGSQMRVVPPAAAHPEWTTPLAQAWVPQLAYLPLHPALKNEYIAHIAEIVTELESVTRPALAHA